MWQISRPPCIWCESGKLTKTPKGTQYMGGGNFLCLITKNSPIRFSRGGIISMGKQGCLPPQLYCWFTSIFIRLNFQCPFLKKGAWQREEGIRKSLKLLWNLLWNGLILNAFQHNVVWVVWKPFHDLREVDTTLTVRRNNQIKTEPRRLCEQMKNLGILQEYFLYTHTHTQTHTHLQVQTHILRIKSKELKES